jgi:hypothetical protein
VAFRPPLSMGLALSKVGNDFGRLPSGLSLREATVGHFEISPLHNFLEKGWSEPVWIGYLEGNPARTLTKCQEDFLSDTRTITDTSRLSGQKIGNLRFPKDTSIVFCSEVPPSIVWSLALDLFNITNVKRNQVPPLKVVQGGPQQHCDDQVWRGSQVTSNAM